MAHADVQAPVLKWKYGGCYSSWCETGWYSSPAVADLDNDGCSEIIFSSRVEKTSSGLRLGKLHILDCQGNLLHEQNLPAPKSSSRHENGALPAPTIANIDSDPDYELVINTINSGFIAYDLPGSTGAKIQWQSVRNRNGSLGEKSGSIVPTMLLLLRRQWPRRSFRRGRQAEIFCFPD